MLNIEKNIAIIVIALITIKAIVFLAFRALQTKLQKSKTKKQNLEIINGEKRIVAAVNPEKVI